VKFQSQIEAARTPAFDEAFVDVAGLRVRYLHAGSGAPIVLIHGLVGSADTWRRNIATLAQNHSVYALDMVNMGKSLHASDVDASLTATANRVAATMDALGISQAEIAGHSHGGAVALTLAALHPERVKRLILFAPANPFCSAGRHLIRFYTSSLGRFTARAIPYVPASLCRFAVGRMFGNAVNVDDEVVRNYLREISSPATIAHILAIVARWHSDMAGLRTQLKHLTRIPMLLIWGARDRAVTLASGRKLQQRLPDAELLVLATAGHLSFEEMPAECNRIVLDWLRGDPAVASLNAAAAHPLTATQAIAPTRLPHLART
jgi:4,5:9,10-diseco-3-hydroxy-5,9,17-trioxoandrosta-1(10),2-diene-4-oate hydrolase